MATVRLLAAQRLPPTQAVAVAPPPRLPSPSVAFTHHPARLQQPPQRAPCRQPLPPCRSSPSDDHSASEAVRQPANTAAASEGGAAATATSTAATAAAGADVGAGGSSEDRRRGLEALAALRARALAPGTVNVYGKPLTRSELSAFEAVLKRLSGEAQAVAAAAAGSTSLQAHLRELLLDAAVARVTPLPEVEGAMVALELLARLPGSATATAGVSAATATGSAVVTDEDVDDPVLVMRRRWQLVVGADVGAVQYIPAVEELQVAPDGSSFTLGTDLDFLFTGFRGPCEWLAPGHLSYTVREVRLEFRWPKAWRRAAAWLEWRRRQPLESSARPRFRSIREYEPHWGDSLPWSPTCHEDPEAAAVLLPLPFFPSNELLTFSCDGRIAATRSKLTGGLILLLEVRTRERLRERLRAGKEAGEGA